jgi:hypothetical protein
MIRLKSLLKEEEVVKNKETGNVYVVQTMNPDKHVKPTPDEIAHAKSKNGGQLPKSEPQSPQKPQNTAPTKPGQKLSGSDFASSAEKKSDGMATVNSIAAKTGLRAQAVAGWADENGVNLSKVSDDLQSKKLNPFDFMTAVVGKPGNNYSKAIIAKYSNNQSPKNDVMPKLKDLMPNATFDRKPLSAIAPIERQQISTVIDKLAELGKQAKEKGEQAPNFNLCQVSIPGTNLYCDGNIGIPREDMPQFKGTPEPGSPADKLPRDSSGEVDTEEFFKEMLNKKGIKVSEPVNVPPDRLKATQSELVGVKVAGMANVLEEPNHPAYGKITAPIYVSNDGYVLDGHHRWAAIVAYNAAHPDKQIPMAVRVVDEPIRPLVKRSNKFAEAIGIKPKAADTGAKGGPTPIVSSEKKKVEVASIKGATSGKEIQTVELPGGGQVFGTVHRNTKMVDDILNHVKSTIPQEKWKDIVFVGEGGSTGDNGEIVFHDEMKYAAPKFKQIGAGIDTWDGDELDVHNDQSKLYKRQMEKTGLNHSQVKAGNWASMIGQGEGTDTMNPNDYLDNEGKQFLQNAAKEAGLPPISSFDNPTGEIPNGDNWKGSGDKGTLYRLSFPEDNKDKETKINNIQVAFNEIRDENILDKSKELQKKGKIPIVVAGEGHVELVKKAMGKTSNLSELSLKGILKSIRI